MNSVEQKEAISIPPTTESNNTEIQQTKSKSKKQRNPLNNSAFRTFALTGGYVQMVSPSAIDAMQNYVDKYLLKPVIKDITLYIGDKIAETGVKKAFRIVQIEKLRSIIQKHVVHDTTLSTNVENTDKNSEFSFHQLTFRKHVNNLTEQISGRTNIQWSGKCVDMLQLAIEHELHMVMSTCGRIIWMNAGEPSKKKKLKLTHKDVRFVFEARYSKR